MEKIAENAETPEKFVHYESDADNTEKIVSKKHENIFKKLTEFSEIFEFGAVQSPHIM